MTGERKDGSGGWSRRRGRFGGLGGHAVAAAIVAGACTAGCVTTHTGAAAEKDASVRLFPRPAMDAAQGSGGGAGAATRAAEIAEICQAYPQTDAGARRWVAARLSNGGLSPTRERVETGVALMRNACRNPTAAARSGL